MAVGLLPSTAATGGRENLPQHIFAPYFETYTSDSPAQLSGRSGLRYLTLAFLETPAVGSCTTNWNGDPTTPVAWSTYGADIARIRAGGGDVIPSFGGFSADNQGRELADSCTSVDAIAAEFERVLTAYGVTRIDLDVEDNSLTNSGGIDRRNKAIKKVDVWAAQRERSVQFVYTLPTNTTGLDTTGVYAAGGCYRSDSIAAASRGSSGTTFDLKRRTTRPSRSTRNFSKFHATLPFFPKSSTDSLRIPYSGCWLAPLTSSLENRGNVTP